MQEVELHYNRPQIKTMLVSASVEYAVMGRGTGKTEGVGAYKTVLYLNSMPRSCGVIIGATYIQILTRTLPGLMYGWEKLGYKQGLHYIVRKRPTEKWMKLWKWQGPYRPPLTFEYFISWWNGAGIHLVSQDRPGSSNGITIDWIYGDEVKLLNRQKLVTELFPANRGLIKAFENCPYHHGMTFTTDMPVGTGGRWILDKENEMDKEKVNDILTYQTLIYNIRQQQNKTKNKKKVAEFESQIEIIEEEINELRKDLLFYQEASTIENIDALGIKYIKDQLRDSSEFEFNTQILNKRPIKIEEGFYPDLNEEVHGYFSFNYKYIDKISFDIKRLQYADCRRDGDLVMNQPLYIAMDYNRRIFPLVVGQKVKGELRTIKGFHVLYPKKIKDVLKQFVDYYKAHFAGNKTVYYVYDHTAIGELEHEPLCDTVINYLKNAGLSVIDIYIKTGLTHKQRYLMWQELLQETGKYPFKFRINRENCKYVLLSMFQAEAEFKKDGWGKNKKSEQDKNFPAEESTHYSESEDTLIIGMIEPGMKIHEPQETSMMEVR